MTQLEWGNLAKRLYEAGVDRGVFYPRLGNGIAWDGLVSVTEDVDDTTQEVTYFDGETVQNRLTLGDYKATVEAVTYPDEFDEYNGYVDHLLFEQERKSFDFSYRTLIGDPIEGVEFGYKLHLVYNALAEPSQTTYATLDNQIGMTAFSWGISTTPPELPDVVEPFYGGVRPSSHLVIDSAQVYPGVLTAIENVLYGSDGGELPRMPLLAEVLTIFESFATLVVVVHGDGTCTVTGPDDVVFSVDATTFRVSWVSVVPISNDTIRVSTF